jgi:hypothetical protein
MVVDDYRSESGRVNATELATVTPNPEIESHDREV